MRILRIYVFLAIFITLGCSQHSIRNSSKDFKKNKFESWFFPRGTIRQSIKNSSKNALNFIKNSLKFKNLLSLATYVPILRSTSGQSFFVDNINSSLNVFREFTSLETVESGILNVNDTLFFSINLGNSRNNAKPSIGSVNLISKEVNFLKTYTILSSEGGEFISLQQSLIEKDDSIYILIYTNRNTSPKRIRTLIVNVDLKGMVKKSLLVNRAGNPPNFPYSIGILNDKLVAAIFSGALNAKNFRMTFLTTNLTLDNIEVFALNNTQNFDPVYQDLAIFNSTIFTTGTITSEFVNSNPILSLYDENFVNLWTKILNSTFIQGVWVPIKVAVIPDRIAIAGKLSLNNTEGNAQFSWIAIFNHAGDLIYATYSNVNSNSLDLSFNSDDNLLFSTNGVVGEGESRNQNQFTLFNKNGEIIKRGTILNMSVEVASTNNINSEFLFVGRDDDLNIMVANLDPLLNSCTDYLGINWINITHLVTLSDFIFTTDVFGGYSFNNPEIITSNVTGTIGNLCIDTLMPTMSPSSPTDNPTDSPTNAPSIPTISPSLPTMAPSLPTISPSLPTKNPTIPTLPPTLSPTKNPTIPTLEPTLSPTKNPTIPTLEPTLSPTKNPTRPTLQPTFSPTKNPNRWLYLLFLLFLIPIICCCIFWIFKLCVARAYNNYQRAESVVFPLD